MTFTREDQSATAGVDLFDVGRRVIVHQYPAVTSAREFLAAFVVFTRLSDSHLGSLPLPFSPQPAQAESRNSVSMLAIFVLATGILGSRTHRGWINILTSASWGMLVRRMLPVAIFTPLLLFWLLQLGIHFKVFNPAWKRPVFRCQHDDFFRHCHFTLRPLNRLDRQRTQAEAELSKTRNSSVRH